MRDRVHIFSSFFHQRLMDSTRDMTGCKDLRYIHVREREIDKANLDSNK